MMRRVSAGICKGRGCDQGSGVCFRGWGGRCSRRSRLKRAGGQRRREMGTSGGPARGKLSFVADERAGEVAAVDAAWRAAPRMWIKCRP